MSQPAVEIKRMFDAPLAQVFEAWTRPDLIAQWWCTPGYRCQNMEIDLQPNGRYRFELVPEEGQEGPTCLMAGQFLEVAAPEYLRYTWAIAAGDFREAGTTVEVSFKAQGQQTDFALRHEGFSSKETYDLHALDWPIVVSNLAQLLGEQTSVERESLSV